jgi:hypothetical protein
MIGVKMTRLHTGWVWLLVFLLACVNKKDRPAFTEENIYLDYAISASDEDSLVTVLLQFKDELYGDALRIPAPGHITLDGVPVLADSSKIGGVYYETSLPVTDFTGDHELVYTDDKNNRYVEKFQFEPLVLNTPIPDTLDGNGLELNFSGIGSRDQLIITYRDTANFHDDHRKAVEPGENSVSLSAADLDELAEGPIQLELQRESRYNLQETPHAGGQLKTSYIIKKELFFRKVK